MSRSEPTAPGSWWSSATARWQACPSAWTRCSSIEGSWNEICRFDQGAMLPRFRHSVHCAGTLIRTERQFQACSWLDAMNPDEAIEIVIVRIELRGACLFHGGYGHGIPEIHVGRTV